jgi:hypothetical protein
MEKIFKLDEEVENMRIIGRRFPQVQDSDTPELFEENGKHDYNKAFEILPTRPYSVKISKGVKLTDVFSSFMVTHSPIVSEKLADLLKPLNLSPFRLIPINVIRVKELVIEKKYYIMHFMGNDLPNVNYKKSTYYYYSGAKDTILDTSILQFEDYEDYLKKREIDHRIYLSKVRKLVMKKSLVHPLFFIDHLNYAHPYIIESLKERFEEEGITGFRFEEVGYIED